MSPQNPVSKPTRRNWLIDASLFLTGLVAALTGIYFLFLPLGGYMGGRNPTYGITILFARETWSDLHLWAGLLMIVAVAVHLPLHWSWVVNMSKRTVRALSGRGAPMNGNARKNLLINLTIALSFLLTAVSGVYFVFVPGERWAPDPLFLFSRSTWDILHTWSAVVLIVAAMLHFIIHWRWIVNVTQKMLRSWSQPRIVSEPSAAAVSLVEN
jgi:cytochrome b subunit of formate dehydrogenase